MTIRYFSIPDLTAGRQSFGFDVMGKRLPADAPADLAARIAGARDAARRWFDLEQARKQARKGAGRRGDARPIDQAIDRALAQIARICSALEGLGDAHPQGVAARAFAEKFFPDGISAVIHVEFEVELQRVEAILAALDAEPARSWVEALPIGGLLDEVRALTPRFRAELERVGVEVTADDVRAARTEARDLMEEAIAGVRVAFADPATRAAVMAPIDEQVKRLRALRRRTRAVPDVDPQTGVEVEVEVDEAPSTSEG